mmetsp:Transcript_55876/g.111993  ORF Transcript_55876/g.111993 Transcript_55876/m.111993 type:complete len:346 (-) Transcript_55876:132-1169(-)
MGNGASTSPAELPSTADEAKEKGFSDEQIDEFISGEQDSVQPDGFCDCSKAPIFSSPVMAGMMMPVMRGVVNGKLAIEKNEADNTAEQVHEKEDAVWSVKGPEAMESFKLNRPYSVKGFVNKAPKAGEPAPDGTVVPVDSEEKSTLHAELKKFGAKFVGLSFDSVTCPVWRGYGGYDLTKAAAGIPVLHVVSLEAHAADVFPTPVNEGGPFGLARQVNGHTSLAERRTAAGEAQAVISKWLKGAHTYVLDDMDNALEAAYESRPFRFYIIDTEDGTVAHACGMSPFNIPAKVRDIKAFVASNAGAAGATVAAPAEAAQAEDAQAEAAPAEAAPAEAAPTEAVAAS